ncbi:MAG TPA: HEAT repeat domain-containing protein [Kofleriaceae bacterium]|nr:HEAT repeat domain-containing protein [Kofleriaceae bacterium]
MVNNLGRAIIGLCDSDRVELRAAAATVLAAVGKGDKAATAALTGRLSDPDLQVRRIALEGLAEMGTGGLAPQLVPLLRSDDDTLAERARQLLARAGASAETTLRKEIGTGPVAARRVMIQLLLQRQTAPAIDAVLDQLADEELGEQALQLVRAELDRTRAEPATGKRAGLAALIETAAIKRTVEAGKQLARAWAAAQQPRAAKAKAKAKARANANARAKAKPKHSTEEAGGSNGAGPAAAPATPEDALQDPDVARGMATLGALLRLVGYLARPETQSLLLRYGGADQPRPIRLAAIAGLRRIVAQSEARGTEKVIEALIDLADGDDLVVAQAAVDTLRGARIPEALAKRFAALAKSKNAVAQKLAMERLPAGGGASAVKALIDALGGDDPTARDAAARGLAKAPEAVLPLIRALLAASDEHIARRYAGVLRSHRGHVSNQAADELVERVRELLELHARGKATTDQIVLERVLGELVADLAPARHVGLLFDRARKLRKAGKAIEAFGSLKPLLRSRADIDTAIDDEQRFLLAVLALEAAGDGLIRTTRTDDPVFDQFARLAAKGFPVAHRLAREDEVSDEAIYALGFRLLESPDGAHQDLGAELLQGIIDERPRSKLAKAARNKLKLTGYLDDE